jgi:2,3-bisphosphoglycerate-independent phosphoglycerate mutase
MGKLSTGHAMSDAVRYSYLRNSDDETLEPLVLMDAGQRPVGRIGKNDAVIFYNIRENVKSN